MTDRELLELAAKAAGITLTYNIFGCSPNADREINNWSPLDDDGDALRLAVKLGIQVTPFLCGACAVATPDGSFKRTEYGYESAETATRRAIVRTAAEIGRSMP